MSARNRRRTNGKAAAPAAAPDVAPEMFLTADSGLVIGQDDTFVGPRVLVFDVAHNRWQPIRLANGQWMLRQATPAPPPMNRTRLVLPGGRPS